MALYVTDTHPLVWYLEGRHQKLSKRALRIFEDATRGRSVVYIPAIVLLEMTYLVRLGRTSWREPFEDWAMALFKQPGFELAPLEVGIVAAAGRLILQRDPFDLAIVATARVKNLPLITKDQDIVESGLVQVVW